MASRLCSFHLYSNIFCVAPPPSFTVEDCCDIMRGCSLLSRDSLSSLWQRGTFLSQAIRSWNTHCVRRTKIPRMYKHFQDSSFARCSSLAFRTYNFHLLLCHTFYPVSYNFITHKDRRARECSFTHQPSKLKATQFN